VSALPRPRAPSPSKAPSQPKKRRVHLKTAVPGPRSAAIVAREQAHLAGGTQSYALMAGVAVEHAAGSTITDVDGNVFLDFIGGIGVGALGHAHPRFVRAIQDQVAKVAVGSLASEPRARLVERLTARAPAPELDRVQLYSTGAEAVESALRLARSHTGKHEMVSFWGGFHGKTLGALSLMGSTFKEGYGPMATGAHLVPYADCYRCPFGLEHPSCGLACAEHARRQIKVQSAGAVAAVVVEPMQGTAGNVIPPPDFLPAVQTIARELDALLIADEMITGFGRTGRYWGVDHSGVVPDVITIGKAFGGGYPLAGVLTTSAVASARPWSRPSGSSSSYGGNPLAAAAGAATLAIIEDEQLVENARVVGERMLSRLRRLEQRCPFVGHVRGAGLLLGVELVKDRKTKEPLDAAVTQRIFQECLRRGLLAMSYASSLRIQPALTIDEAAAREGVAILEEAFDAVEREGRWR
jgi:4-aminobutyrate aminotransferase / (S)-3-amino-2-methylpropionate transaminase / 5-aminovalerate transaminase